MKVNKIILHHSLTEDDMRVSWSAIRDYHIRQKGWKDIGYHYGIERAGSSYEIFVGRLEDEDGAHTVGQNDVALGICFVGNFDVAPVPERQWELGLKLVRGILRRYKSLTPFDVFGHRHFAHKSCPGKLFSIMGFREAI